MLDLAADRRRDPARYAIANRAPRHAWRPADAAEVAAIVRECAQRGWALVPWGGGVALERETIAPERYDAAIDLSALDAIRIYERDDYTVTAGCGITLAALRERLAEQGQELPLESASIDRATLGGVLAANAGGARRLAFGGTRDRSRGARFVPGDGTLAHTGGRVVKNVAGHAVHRLLCGSRGGLAILVEASLKLMPMPPARAALVHDADESMLATAARWAGLPRREPAALTVLGRAAPRAHAALDTTAPYTVVTGFEGDPAWVESCVQFATEKLGAPKHVLRGVDVPPLWQALADASEWRGPRLSFASAHNTPDAVGAIGSSTAREHLVFHAPAGRLHVGPRHGEAPALTRTLASAGFALIDAHGVDPEMPAPPLPLRELRERISRALDPAGVMGFGARWKAGR